MSTRSAAAQRRLQRPSTSGSTTSASSSSFSGSRTTDTTDFANYSPTSEALSLTDDEDGYAEARPDELDDPWEFVPKVSPHHMCNVGPFLYGSCFLWSQGDRT